MIRDSNILRIVDGEWGGVAPAAGTRRGQVNENEHKQELIESLRLFKLKADKSSVKKWKDYMVECFKREHEIKNHRKLFPEEYI